MRLRRWLRLWLLAILALVGCRGEDAGLDDVVVELTVLPDPPYVGPATVVISLTDDQGAPIAGATLSLEGNMTHAGMVPSLAEAIEVSPGRYEAVLDLTMGGDWYILVQGKLPDGRTLEHTADLPGVKSPIGSLVLSSIENPRAASEPRWRLTWAVAILLALLVLSPTAPAPAEGPHGRRGQRRFFAGWLDIGHG